MKVEVNIKDMVEEIELECDDGQWYIRDTLTSTSLSLDIDIRCLISTLYDMQDRYISMTGDTYD